MGTISLRLFLQSLCCNSRWNYAVFWKLQLQNQMLLAWEDGYFDISRPRESMESILDGIRFKDSDKILFSNCESSVHDGNSSEYPIGLAVAEMSRGHYALGEGAVGEVAYTGNHRWIFSDNVSAGELTSKLVPKFPDEWLLQFVAGIKTILLVPVVPHGVLQLGSLEMVAEDLALIAYIKDKFNAYQNFVGYSVPFTSNGEFPAQSSLSLMSIFMENLDESSAILMNEMKSEENSNAVDRVKPTNHNLSTTNQMMPPCIVQDSCHISGKDMKKILNSAIKNDSSVESVGLIEVSRPLNQSANGNKYDMTESDMFKFSCLEEELQTFSYSDNYNVGVFGEYSNETMNSFFDGGMMEQPFVDNDADDTFHKNFSSFFSFPSDCELHKALGPDFLGHPNQYFWDSSVSGADAYSSASLICNEDIFCGIEPSAWESTRLFVKDNDAEHLLEAVVANACSGSDDNSSNRANSTNSVTASLGQFAASSMAQSQSEGSALVGECTAPWSCGTPACVARGRTATTNSYPLASSFESMMSGLIEEQQQEKAYGYLHPHKGSKVSNTNKRRARSGDNQRPRPRDRQLIQDRVKELRELVPNGAKCSIDGLLDRTIKHMLFLRSVTDQADKLAQWVHQEVTGRRNLKSLETNGGRQNGKSWAFELGSENQLCPIVVEDLEHPGHMLIEMLCNDHGRFLEIAEVIRNLELTILEGVMESRSDNTWAHFIVETSRGFHRLDIFWPLMRLLQHNRTPISSKI